MPDKIKVLIVDDASFMVKALTDILNSDPDIEIVGSAKNGQEALMKIKSLKPDVVTLDVDMPVMDGISAVRHIMIQTPVPIVMLSSLFNHGDITFEALRLGVVDFLPKPSGAISLDIHEQGNKIIDRVKIAAAENIANVRRVKLCKVDPQEHLAETYGYRDLEHIITIGTTLGGPNTIIRLMSRLPPRIPAAVVVIQEIATNILPAFVQEFNSYTHWKVEAGFDGKVIQPGCCYICSYSEPMIIRINQSQEAILRSNPDTTGPLDALFASASHVFEQNAIGVLLSGVGSEGDKGLQEIKSRAGTTIAQNTDTCVYPNLTRCAIENGVVDVIANADELSVQIERVVGAASA